MSERLEMRSQLQREKPRHRRQQYREPTQEERLEEAKYTAEFNKLSLQRLIQIEEEIKTKARGGRKRNALEDYKGPIVTYYSRCDQDNGEPLYIYHNLDSVPYKDQIPPPRLYDTVMPREFIRFILI